MVLADVNPLHQQAHGQLLLKALVLALLISKYTSWTIRQSMYSFLSLLLMFSQRASQFIREANNFAATVSPIRFIEFAR